MSTTASSIRWYTPETAASTLPFVGAVISDIAKLREDIRTRQARVDEMLLARGEGSGSPYQDELEAMRRSLDGDRKRLREFVDELMAISISVSETHATAEFPAWANDRAVWLCWTLGEESIVYWRETFDSISERRSIEGVSFGEGPEIEA